MSTRSLVTELMDHLAGAPSADAVPALHRLLDDATIEDGDAPLGITEAAELVGLTAHTLRYYEARGLVHPGRTSEGHRSYGPADLRRLVFLTRMRVAGMPMAELERYVRLVEEGEATVPARRRMMLDQRERIDRQIRELTLARQATEYKLRTYTAPG